MDPVSMLIPVAESIITSAAKQLAGSATQGVRARVFGDPEQKALARALARAFATVEKRHGRRLADFDVNAGFWTHEGAEELAKALVPGTAASAAALARRAVDSLGAPASEDERLDRIVLLRPVFATLLDELSVEMREEPNLQAVLGRTDAADSAQATTQLAMHAGAGVAGEDDLIAYLRWLADQHRYLRTVGVVRNTTVQLPLAEVFVGLSARPEKHPGDRARPWFEQERDKLAAMVESGRLDATGFEAALDRLHLQAGRRFDVADEPDRARPAPVLDAVRTNAQSLVLGDPGTGKTTLLKHLALTHALALASGKPVQGKPARFPIYLRIGDYARQGYPDQGIGEFLPGYLNRLECRTPGLADLLRRELDAGRCLVLLDGLDEIASAELRRGVVEAVTRFVTAHARPGNRFVVTSRIAGYQAAPLSEPFVAVRLQDMDRETIDRFLEVYCREVERAETPDKSDPAIVQAGQQEAAAIREALATNPGVRRLATNPLLLTALVLVHRASGRLPHRRVEAYVEVCNALGRTWRTAQGIAAADLPDERMLTRWLTELGSWMHEHRPEGAASQLELLTVLGPLWAKHHGVTWDPAVVEAADPLSTDAGVGIAEFVDKADRHTGLLIERAPGRYGFPHLTFEEYYAGRALAFLGTVEQRSAAIRSRLHDPRYDEPILLALGLIGTDYTEQIETVVAEAIWPATAAPSRYEDLLGRDFLFMLRVLADDTPLQTATIDAVLHHAIDEWLTPETSRCRFRSYRQALSHRLRGLAGTKAGDRFRAILDQQAATLADANQRAFAGLATVANYLDPITPSVRTALTAIAINSDVNPDIRVDAMMALEECGLLTVPVVDVAVQLAADVDVDSSARTRMLEVLAKGRPRLQSAANSLIRIAVETAIEPSVRAAAVMVLAECRALTKHVVRAAVELSADSHVNLAVPVRAWSALAENVSTNPVVVDALVELAVDATVDSSVRVCAVGALAAGGSLTRLVEETAIAIAVDATAVSSARVGALWALVGRVPMKLAASVVGVADEAAAPSAEVSISSGVEIESLTSLVVDALAGIAANAAAEPSVRGSALWVLARDGSLTPSVMRVAVDGGVDPYVLVEVVETLADDSSLTPSVVEAAVEMAVDCAGDPRLLVEVAGVLAEVGLLTPSVVEAAVGIAVDCAVDPQVRVDAVDALAAGGSLIPLVVNAALGIAINADVDPSVRVQVAKVLVEHGSYTPSVILAAFGIAANTGIDSHVRAEAMELSARVGSLGRSVIAAALEIAANTDVNQSVRRTVVRALRQAWPLAEAIDGLLSLLTDKNKELRHEVGRTLVALARQHPTSAEAIVAALVAVCSRSTGDEHDGEDRPGMDEAYQALRTLVGEPAPATA